MIFEEALAELRKGKKILHPLFEEDEYLMGCYVGLKFCEESFEQAKERGISISKMKGEFAHPDMVPRLPIFEAMDLCEKYPFLKDKIMCPQLNLFLIVSDDWVVLDE